MKSPRILFLCTACPFGTSGSGVRTLHLARILQDIGPVTMLAASSLDWTEQQLAQTRQSFNFAGLIKYQEAPVRGLSNRYRQIFDPRFLNSNGVVVSDRDQAMTWELLASHDLVWIHTLKLANCFRRFQWPRSVMDVDDIPSRYHRLAASHADTLASKMRRWRNAFAERRREALSFDRFSVLTVCKESDRGHFNHDPRVHVVPNGFPVPAAASHTSARGVVPVLGMIGDFGHLPNSNGLHWFAREVWPIVRAQVPTATLRLVGKLSVDMSKAYPDLGVVGLGYVDDTAAEIAGWSAMIVPTRLGGGSHLKVAEGLARRVPIVTTRHGARGYQIEHDRHALIADTEKDFADACVRLLRSPEAGSRLTDAGWDLFQAQYSWDSIRPAVESTVEHCLRLNATTPSAPGA